jgi:hypothetical protein
MPKRCARAKAGAMFQSGRYIFKRAETTLEFEQIRALNYATFVREVPQHEDPGNGRLVDKFEEKSDYFVALRSGRIVGMVSAHDQPPFSVASRLPDPGMLEATGIRPLEIRLLAIEPDERRGVVLAGLLWALHQHVSQANCTHLFISGLEERLELYRGLGFEALGPGVVSGQARYVPMMMSVARLVNHNARAARLWQERLERQSKGAS